MISLPEILSALGLLVVFVLVLVCAYYATKWIGKRYSGQLGGTSGNIKVLDKISLGQDRMLFIIEAAGETMLIGVTPQHIEKLGDVSPEALLPTSQGGTVSFVDTLRQTMKDGWGIGGKKSDPGSKEEPHE